MKAVFISIAIPENLREVPVMASAWWKKPLGTKAIDLAFLVIFCGLIYKIIQ